MTRSNINSFAEVLQGYQQYMVYIQRAAALKQQMHVILNLRAVTKIDPKIMSYVGQMREVLKSAPDLPPTVTQLTVQLSSPALRTVLKQILQLCVGKHVKVTMEA
jgi:hypothetical protein